MPARLACLLLIALGVLCRPPEARGQPTNLSGTASWTQECRELVCDFVRKTYHMEIAAAPQAYPTQTTAAGELNAEFVNRLNLVVALWQAHPEGGAQGGGRNIGLRPGDGGLRQAEDQRRIFRRGRTLRPGGDPNNHADYRETGPVVTGAWTSWHQVGLAADMTLYQNGAYVPDVSPGPGRPGPQQVFVDGPAWAQARQLGMDMGMWPGAHFRRADPAHLEWHPKYSAVWNDVLDFIQDHPGTQEGAAAADIDAGYDWTIPSTVHYFVEDHGKPGHHEVTDLVARDGWLCVQAYRILYHGDQAASWAGIWVTLDPPLPLFPAYMPVHRVDLSSGSDPRDSRWRRESSFTLHAYRQDVAGGKVTGRFYVQQSGSAKFDLFLTMEDLLKTANTEWAMRAAAPQLAAFRTNDVYSLLANLRLADGPEQAVSGREPTFTTLVRQVDEDGYTSDSNEACPFYLGGSFGLGMAWNRENANIGFLQKDAQGRFALPVAESRAGDGTVARLSGTVPPGAWDEAQWPAMPPPNPRPSSSPSPTATPTPSRGDGFLQP
ncbi:MAG: hypothetical protein AB1758_05265 [Candidatus Eremiobacterota bacterium]